MAGISDEDAIMIVIDRNALGIVKPVPAELGHERAAIIVIATREYLRSMIPKIEDEQEASMMVECQGLDRKSVV